MDSNARGTMDVVLDKLKRVDLDPIQANTAEEAAQPVTSLEVGQGELNGKQLASEIKMECTQTRTQLDEVLIEALRVPRDRIFVLLQEKDMEDRIRNGQDQDWELPLMNSYQRLLVHRIADHFRLAHSIDAVTKAVTLTRQGDTEIPEMSLSTLAMADMERLSEPAYAISRDSSAAGFKIMRREGAGRADSPRNGLPEGRGSGKDRRNMTIEEREAAYKEARQRIFGSEEASGENILDSVPSLSGEVEVKNLPNLSLEVGESSRIDSRKSTPGRLSPAPSSTSSSSSAAFLRAGAPSFDPSQRGTPVEGHWQAPPYGYPVIDTNGNQYFTYPGGFVWPPYLQHDANGRQIVLQGPGPLMSPTYYPYPTPGSNGSNQDVYSSIGHSPSVSSRSTSVSADTEGEVSLLRDQANMTTAGRGRPHSLSPSASFQHQQSRNGSNYHPSGSSNGNSSNSGGVGAAGTLVTPHVFQGQVPVPASWNYHPYSTPVNYSNRPYQQQTAPMHNLEEMNNRNQHNHRMGYAAALANGSRSGSGTIASSSSSVHSMESAPGYLSPVASSSSRIDDMNHGSQSRSRNSLSERSLFDPNKSSNHSNNSNSGSTGSPYQQGSRAEDNARRHSMNKSTSAAEVSESRPGLDPMRSGSLNSSKFSLNPEIGRPSTTATSTSPTDLSRRMTPPSHPSLPARPDWAIPVRSRFAIDPTKDDSCNHKVPS